MVSPLFLWIIFGNALNEIGFGSGNPLWRDCQGDLESGGRWAELYSVSKSRWSSEGKRATMRKH